MTTDILAIGAHPDDIELSCGGTLAALARQGKKIGVLDLTKGEMATRGTPEIRLKEADVASEVLGLTLRENAGLPDSGLDNNPFQRETIIRFIRAFRPAICLVPPASDRHPDHRNASQLITDALFYSGLSNLKTLDASKQDQAPWRPYHILHYMQHWPFEPTFVFDVTSSMHLKEKAILAYSSQFNVDPQEGPETYISGKTFFDSIRARAREYGQQAGFTYGEPFRYFGTPVPVNRFDFLIENRPKR